MKEIYLKFIYCKPNIWGLKLFLYKNGSFHINVGSIPNENYGIMLQETDDAKNKLRETKHIYNSDDSIICNEFLDYIKSIFIMYQDTPYNEINTEINLSIGAIEAYKQAYKSTIKLYEFEINQSY